MSTENEMKKIKSDLFWLKVVMTFAVLTLGVLAVDGNRIHSKSVAKITEIADKAGVECETKTNTLFGVMTKIKLVK